jgi:hypothetical protein
LQAFLSSSYLSTTLQKQDHRSSLDILTPRTWQIGVWVYWRSLKKK